MLFYQQYKLCPLPRAQEVRCFVLYNTLVQAANSPQISRIKMEVQPVLYCADYMIGSHVGPPICRTDRVFIH